MHCMGNVQRKAKSAAYGTVKSFLFKAKIFKEPFQNTHGQSRIGSLLGGTADFLVMIEGGHADLISLSVCF